ncbi:hypothetical protein ENTCAN_09454 [Enterobacter cancerogenus ATCC 35316]|nr:hypothetical protein ENTCAN_09454 [Enterobacter cancerogenus ATCC 35316]
MVAEGHSSYLIINNIRCILNTSLSRSYNPLGARVKHDGDHKKILLVNLLNECRKWLSKVFKGGETVNNLPRLPIDTRRTIPAYKKATHV